jgi:hypothetical protein
VSSVCLSASPAGALLEGDVPDQGELTVVFDEPPALVASARGRVVSRAGKRVAVAFSWEAPAAREAFGTALYGSRPRPRAEVDPPWRKAEAMGA